MNIKRLEVLIAINEYKNVSKAAKKLALKQPTVTFHMKQLEQEMNTRIFMTNNSVTTLTQAGKALVSYAYNILALSKDATRTMASFNPDLSYNIRIGSSNVPATYILPQCIKQFKEHSPNTNFTITVMTAPEIQTMLLDYQIDIGIVSSTDKQLDHLQSINIYTDEMVIVYPPTHPFAHAKTLTGDLLITQSFIFHSPRSTTQMLIDQWMKDTGIKLNSPLQIKSVEAIKQSIRCELGLGILSKLSVQEEIDTGKLCCSPLPIYTPSRNVYIIYNKEKYMPNIVSNFIAQLQQLNINH